MSWEGTDGQFVIIRPDHVAQLWGERNGRRNMTYQKFSRALRYYYHKKVLTKIRGQKYTYKFNLQELERQYGYTDIWPLATSESRGNGGRMISPSGARICDVLPASSHVMKFASHEIPDTPFEPLFIHTVSLSSLILIKTELTVLTLKPGHLEEACPITTFQLFRFFFFSNGPMTLVNLISPSSWGFR